MRNSTGLKSTTPGEVVVTGRACGDSNSDSEFANRLTSANQLSNISCKPAKTAFKREISTQTIKYFYQNCSVLLKRRRRRPALSTTTCVSSAGYVCWTNPQKNGSSVSTVCDGRSIFKCWLRNFFSWLKICGEHKIVTVNLKNDQWLRPALYWACSVAKRCLCLAQCNSNLSHFIWHHKTQKHRCSWTTILTRKSWMIHAFTQW